MKFFVSRQCYWSDGRNVVEIAQGGIDYANPDMLVPKYGRLGEGKEYIDPVEAVEAAVKIAAAWRADAPEETIGIVAGCTHGFTIPFEDVADTEEATEAELRKWAEQARNVLPRCAYCSRLMGESVRTADPFGEEYEFCDDSCAERFLEKYYDEAGTSW